jgi:hypothetical protein
VLLTILAATIGTLKLVTYAAAVDSNSTNNSAATSVTYDSSQNATQLPPLFGGLMMMDQEPGGFIRGPRGHGPMGSGMGNIRISSEYAANVNAILNNDTDVAALIAQGYNVTAIHPNIKTVVQGDGTIATKATTATVFLQGSSGYATVNVDIANARVTQIVEVTRTVINKNTS